MVKSQSKRAVQARKYRDSAREKRRMNKVVAEYVQYKYVDIYNECSALYHSLKKKYPNLGQKCDLTKTPMFRRLTQNDSDTSSSNHEQHSTTEDSFSTSTTNEHDSTTDNFSTSTCETVSVSEIFTTTTTNEPGPSVENFVSSISEPVPGAENLADTTTNEPVSTVGDDFMASTSEPLQPPVIPVQHLHINYNSVGELYEELVNEGEYVNINALNNNLLQDIVNELEHDEDINELLNNVQQVMEQEEIDEGIDLNVENEIEELLDFNVEYDF